MTPRSRAAAASPAVLLSLLTLSLAGCELGPNFFSPAPPEATEYASPGERNLGDGPRDKRTLDVGARIASDWWTIFHSPALDRVMKQAIADSPSLAQAQAQLAFAREQIIVAQGAELPQVDLTGGIARQEVNVEISGNPRPPIPVNIYSISPTVSYPLDIFGGLKRTVESREASAELSQDQLAAAYLALTGNIAMQSITIASVRAEMETVERIIADDERNLKLVKTAQEAGTATEVDVTSAQSQLANDRTLIPPLRQRLSVAKHALAVFAGKVPIEFDAPDFDLRGFALPNVIPVTLPSTMVRDRPDILAAEAQMHVASANIGVATAALYPNLTLGATFAQQATQLTNFFSGAYSAFSIGASAAAPIFHGGALKAQQRAAYAAFDAAFAAYKQVVIQAFGQVADSLQALLHDDQDVASQAAAVAAADKALKLARLSFQEGNTTLLQVLDSERQADRANIGLVQARSRRVLDTAQLFVALGSGWWNTPPLVPPPPATPAAAK
ncbi:MAG TPA: efflux transporter outer membrane subunit [Stellaceae bacterium]|jgi:NodT family efflux transporter outer membrane factor (OMF) lipoprotein